MRIVLFTTMAAILAAVSPAFASRDRLQMVRQRTLTRQVSSLPHGQRADLTSARLPDLSSA
jgi:hypothetical protein